MMALRKFALSFSQHGVLTQSGCYSQTHLPLSGREAGVLEVSCAVLLPETLFATVVGCGTFATVAGIGLRSRLRTRTKL